ncbi:MAG: hypothetical protein COA57_09330 [Flavobacteriales bacterium]|nr:MAG: hypothetical protein COA57_09330 [Flavobacteriales bacterium]
MDLDKILSISGKPGLYKMIGQMKNGVIVESLEDGKRMPALAAHQISALEDISIYCAEEDKPFKEVLRKMHEHSNGKEVGVSLSDADGLKKYFEEMLPEYDKDRVYVSDIRKAVKWYNALLKADLITLEEEEKGAAAAPAESNPEKEDGEDVKIEDDNSNKTQTKGKSSEPEEKPNEN